MCEVHASLRPLKPAEVHVETPGALTCGLQVHFRHVLGQFTGAGPGLTLPRDVRHCVPATRAIAVDEV